MGFPLDHLSNNRWMALAWGTVLALVGGCGQAKSKPKDTAVSAPPSLPNHFDPSSAGAIRGQVVWQGDIPKVLPFLVRANPTGGEAFAKRQIQPNPNAPLIHSQNHGVGNAVVFLRAVD